MTGRRRTSVGSRGRVLLGLCGGLLSVQPLAGCAGGAVRTAVEARPLQERRALAVIAEAIRDAGQEPAAGREVPLGGGVNVRVDVGVQGRRFGIAYLSAADRAALGSTVQLLPSNSAELQVVRGADDDAETRILLLQDSHYLFDDTNDEENEQRTLTAELTLSRDVTDFLVRARSERWP